MEHSESTAKHCPQQKSLKDLQLKPHMGEKSENIQA